MHVCGWLISGCDSPASIKAHFSTRPCFEQISNLDGWMDRSIGRSIQIDPVCDQISFRSKFSLSIAADEIDLSAAAWQPSGRRDAADPDPGKKYEHACVRSRRRIVGERLNRTTGNRPGRGTAKAPPHLSAPWLAGRSLPPGRASIDRLWPWPRGSAGAAQRTPPSIDRPPARFLPSPSDAASNAITYERPPFQPPHTRSPQPTDDRRRNHAALPAS